jgi:hypothetical protein
MKSIIVSAILTLCVVAAFQFLSSSAGKPETTAIKSGEVFFSGSTWCPDGSKILSGRRLSIGADRYTTVCQKN